MARLAGTDEKGLLYRLVRAVYRRLPLSKALALPLRRIVKRAFSRSMAMSYARWIAAFDTLSDSDRSAIGAHIKTFPTQPKISVLMLSGGASGELSRRSQESVRRQLYTRWTLDEALRETSDYTAVLEAGDELSEHALYFAVLELQNHPVARLIFSDEDHLDGRGRRAEPCFKPDFSPDFFLARNRPPRLAVYETRLLREAGGPHDGSLDLALRCVERLSPAEIRHVPRVLYHARDARVFDPESSRRAVQAHLDRVCPGARVVAAPGAPDCNRVIYPLAEEPLVSILIPTKDHAQLLARCLESIRERTDYSNYEILIIDNGSSDPKTLDYLEAQKKRAATRVLRDASPFNYSALNNMAARQARGEVLVLMNDDAEAIGRDWLREMVSHAMRPEIGAVGAKLYNPDDTIHHAGVVVGMGEIACHHHDGFARDARGYFENLLLTGNPSAVTAACLAVRKDLYLACGGLDEELARDFNDVDFCLRLGARGFRVLWTPYAQLYHYVSASRGYLEIPANLAAFNQAADLMRRRWGQEFLAHDPAYNPNLSLADEDFRLAAQPRLELRPYLQDKPLTAK